MIVLCPQCSRKYKFDESRLQTGPLKVRCPTCKKMFVVSSKIPEKAEPKAPPPSKTKGNTGKLIILRTLVGYLGEKNQYNWWDTNFLSPVGLKFLQINFPRTHFAAGINSVTEAAKRLHDKRIGKGGVFHLFRLPAFLEENVHRNLMHHDSNELLTHIKSKEIAIDRLKNYMKNGEDTSEGPVLIGTENMILAEESISKLALYYYKAFTSNYLNFPYFSILYNE